MRRSMPIRCARGQLFDALRSAICVLALALSLAACGSQATAPARPTPPAPSPAIAASAISAQTATPAASTSPTPTQAPMPTLSPQPSQPPAAGWQRYENAEAGFGVELPAAPDEQSNSAPTLIGPIDTFIATVQFSATQTLRVVATRYPQRLFEIDDIGGLNTFEAARDALLRNTPVRGLSERAVLFGPSPGRELLVPPGSDGFFLRAQLFVVGSTLFQLELRDTRAPLGAVDDQAMADRFFGSFERLGPPAPVTQGWQPTALGDAFCSLWLPGAPAKSLRQIETSAGPLDRITYAVDQPARGLRLLVSATPYPAGSLHQGDEAVERELNRARDNVIGELMGSHADETLTYYGAAQGRELRMGTPDGGYAIVRLYMLGSILYELALGSSNPIPAPAEGRPSVPSGDEVGRFFLTFEPQ